MRKLWILGLCLLLLLLAFFLWPETPGEIAPPEPPVQGAAPPPD
ncbi:hypothetical protein SH611_18590 [Geminicoccaceae bacterium 1502E]|nr:hypothetical protein [Geminicoccaceae bacterium 1502E]